MDNNYFSSNNNQTQNENWENFSIINNKSEIESQNNNYMNYDINYNYATEKTEKNDVFPSYINNSNDFNDILENWDNPNKLSEKYKTSNEKYDAYLKNIKMPNNSELNYEKNIIYTDFTDNSFSNYFNLDNNNYGINWKYDTFPNQKSH